MDFDPPGNGDARDDQRWGYERDREDRARYDRASRSWPASTCRAYWSESSCKTGANVCRS